MASKTFVNGNIYSTMDYSMFKKLEGNRAVDASRKAKIRRSIEQNGYIPCPVAINEKNETIDGQCRVEVLMEKGLPIDYYIIPGAGIKECIAMNIYGTKWKMKDYIASYAEQGDRSYMKLNALMDIYKGVRLGTICFAAKGTDAPTTTIMNGTLEITDEEYSRANDLLAKFIQFLPTVKRIKGNRDNAEKAIMFILGCENVNFDTFRNRLESWDIPSIGQTTEALRIFSEAYNYRSRQSHVAWDVDYANFMRNKFAWYENKWGNRE